MNMALRKMKNLAQAVLGHRDNQQQRTKRNPASTAIPQSHKRALTRDEFKEAFGEPGTQEGKIDVASDGPTG